MRGKHERARARQEAAALLHLQVEIEAETLRVATAQARAEQSRTAKNRLAVEQRRTTDRLRSQAELAGTVAAAVGPAWESVTHALANLGNARRRLHDVRDHDSLLQLSNTGARLNLHEVHRSAGAEFRYAWYQRRTGKSINFTRSLSVHHWVPADIPDDRDTMASYVLSTVHSTTPQARYAWAVPPWLRPPTDESDAQALRAKLGATHAGTPRLTTHPNPPPIRKDATINTPWRHAPLIGEPADAADLASWYSRSADSQGWSAGAAPVPFLLPAEQTFGYPQAPALPADTMLRLPYPAIFVSLAQPWQLPPTPTDEPAPDNNTRIITMYARGRAAQGAADTLERVLRRLHSIPDFNRADLPTPLQAVMHFGGDVEGLILIADDRGHPTNEFAWCIAIRHPTGLPLGRVTVPAAIDKTAWQKQIQNIVAGLALSCWHQPVDLATTTQDQRKASPTTGADLVDLDVRILDIDTTSPPRRNKHHRREGRSPRAHIRRGHWRRQRTGRGRTETRWAWVRPTTVSGIRHRRPRCMSSHDERSRPCPGVAAIAALLNRPGAEAARASAIKARVGSLLIR